MNITDVADIPLWFDLMLKKVAPSLFYRGVFEYRVFKHSDGKLDIEPTDPNETISEGAKAEVWAGIAGYSVNPKPGTIVLLAFVKGDTSKPRVVGFCPRSYTVPNEMQVDADSILFGTSGHKSVVRAGDTCGTMTATASPITVTLGDGSAWQIAATASGNPVLFTITPLANPTNVGKLLAYSSSKVKAQ